MDGSAMTPSDRIAGLEAAILVKDRLLDDLVIQLAAKDVRIAELEIEVVGLRASLRSIFETEIASMQAKDECVGTFVDLNLSLQQELTDAQAIIDDTFDELVETDRRAQTLELQLLATAAPRATRRAN
jgi:hypothetical protein